MKRTHVILLAVLAVLVLAAIAIPVGVHLHHERELTQARQTVLKWQLESCMNAIDHDEDVEQFAEDVDACHVKVYGN